MTPQAREDIIAHAIECWPRESVGYLKDGEYHRLTNCIDGDAATSMFELSSVEATLVAQEADALVHSHPEGTDHPTKDDIEVQARMKKPWYIVVMLVRKDNQEPYVREIFEFSHDMPVQPYEGRHFRYMIQDCRTLVKDWLNQEMSIPFDPGYDEFGWWWEGKDLIMDRMEQWGFVKIREADVRRGDVVLMKVNCAVVNHLGIYLGNGQMLHHPAQRLSKIVNIESWRGVIDGYARYVR